VKTFFEAQIVKSFVAE